jgi:hypothetical protein
MTKETHHAAIAAIQFALSNPEGMEFLRLWNEGEFDILRRDWPEAPDSVYIGADSKSADVARPKRRPYNASGSLSEYGVFPECDVQQPAEQRESNAPVGMEGFDEWFDEYTKNNYTDEMLAEAAWKAALAQQSNDIALGGCTTNGADVWCNGHIVATAHGLTLAPYRAARIAACLNACAGIEDPVAFIQRAKESGLWRCTVCGRIGTVGRCCGEETREPLAHSRSVINQSLHWNGVPVHVTGTVTTSPGNWSLIDAALATQQREPKP